MRVWVRSASLLFVVIPDGVQFDCGVSAGAGERDRLLCQKALRRVLLTGWHTCVCVPTTEERNGIATYMYLVDGRVIKLRHNNYTEKSRQFRLRAHLARPVENKFLLVSVEKCCVDEYRKLIGKKTKRFPHCPALHMYCTQGWERI